MSPEALTVVERLRLVGLLPEPGAARLGRIARGELLSIRTELRLALYAGVLLVTGGVGVLVREHLERLGPVTIAMALTLAVAGCFLWVARHASPFSWAETKVAHLAFDYVLLLGVLLGAADLAYLEVQFTPLGAAWPWHLLLVSLLTALAAFRYDSRLVSSLSLSTFAAWRGVSVELHERGLWRLLDAPSRLRANAIGCALLFLLLGFFLRQAERKAHFEPVATHLGWLLLLAALVSGIGTRGDAELAWTLVLLVTALGLAAGAARARRFALLAMGVVAAFIAVSALFHRLEPSDVATAAWYLLTSLALLAGLAWAQRHLKEEA